MKLLKGRRMTDGEADYQELRLLRQRIYIAEQYQTYRINSDKEYQKELRDIASKVMALEAKYGINDKD